MGIPFPLLIKAIDKGLIAWSWAINGSASVLSPILAIFLAIFLDYNVVFILAGIIYLLGLIFVLGLSQLMVQK